MSELALLDEYGTVANIAVIADSDDELLVAALVAAGNHTAGVMIPEDRDVEADGGVAIGWTYSKRTGFVAPPSDG